MRNFVPPPSRVQAASSSTPLDSHLDALRRLASLARLALRVRAVLLLHEQGDQAFCVAWDGVAWGVSMGAPAWLAQVLRDALQAAPQVHIAQVVPQQDVMLGWARACLCAPIRTADFQGAWVTLDATSRVWTPDEAAALCDASEAAQALFLAAPALATLEPAAASLPAPGENQQGELQKLVDEAVLSVGAHVGALFYDTGQSLESATQLPLRAVAGASSTLFPSSLLRSKLTDGLPPGGALRLGNVEDPGALGLGALPVRSVLWVPVRRHPTDGVRGALLLGHHQSDAFSDRDAQSAQAVARQAAVLVENARLYEQSRRAEILLREELEFSAAVANSLGEGVLAFTVEGRITFANAAAAELLQVSEAQLTGRDLHAFMRCEHAAADLQRCAVFAAVREGRTMRGHECLFSRRDGAAMLTSCSVAPIAGEQGASGAVLAFHDMSEHKAQQQTLLFQKSLLESQTEASVDGILVVSNEGKVLLYNSRFVTLWRVPLELAAQRSDEKLLAQVNGLISDPGEFRSRVDHLYRNPYEASQEKVSLKDGRIFDRYSAPVKGDYGSLYGRVWFFRDISDEMHALRQVEQLAQELSTQQQWLNNLLNLLPVPVLLLDPRQMQVVFANKAADRFAGGVFPKLCLGGDALPPELGPFATTFGPPAMRAAAGERFSGWVSEWARGASNKTLLLHSELMSESPGHRAVVVLAFDDITELTRIQSELQRSVRVRDEFLSVASHELKTPVTALHLQIQSVLRAGERGVSGGGAGLDWLTSRAEWVVGKITRAETQVMRLIRLIDNLLDVSRITAGRLEFETEEVDLGQLTADVAERLREEAVRVGCELRLDMASVVGTWDRLRLEQVVTNLLTNALKYGSGQPVELRVRFTAADTASLTVRDYGIGISPENQARIFERFERAVSERQYGGLGLGLWITRQIVEALRGRVYVESGPGEGSLFTVDLPRVPPPDSDAPPAPTTPAD